MSDTTEEAARVAHNRFHSINPFMRVDERPKWSINTYRVLTIISWLVVVITSFFYEFNAPHEGKHKHKIWRQNKYRPTPFALNSIITSIYWLVVYILQIGYVWHLYSGDGVYVSAAANVGAHFILNNLLYFAFVMLWVRGFFWWALLILIVNFFNLSAAYFRHPKTPRFIHIPVVAAPLAFNFVALYWVGAAAVNAQTLPARILANIAIWGIGVYGMFFLVAYKDWTIGFALSVLAASLGVAQFLTHIIAFQWIFAFVNMAVLFLFSLWVAVPHLIGKEPFKRGTVVSEDREREPLLPES